MSTPPTQTDALRVTTAMSGKRGDSVKRYRIEYRDEDPSCPIFSCTVKAHDREHALERFLDAPDGDGWVIVRISEHVAQTKQEG